VSELIVGIEESFLNAIDLVVGFTPKLIAAFAVLIIGLFIGQIVGRLVTRVLEATKVSKVIEETPLGEIAKQTGMDFSEFLSGVARWFMYLIFIMASVDILDVELFSQFLKRVVDYLPSLIAGIVILVLGLVFADFVLDWIKNITKSMDIEGGEILDVGMRIVFFLVITLLALDQMRIDTSIIYLFLNPLAWALAVVVVFKWGVKGVVIEYAKTKGK